MPKKRKTAKKEASEPQKTARRDEAKAETAPVSGIEGAENEERREEPRDPDKWQSLKKELEIYRIELNDNISRTEALQQDVNEVERKHKTMHSEMRAFKKQLEEMQASALDPAMVAKMIDERLAAMAGAQVALREKVQKLATRFDNIEKAVSSRLAAPQAARPSEGAAPDAGEDAAGHPASGKMAPKPEPSAALPAAAEAELPADFDFATAGATSNKQLFVELQQNNRTIGPDRPLTAGQSFQARLKFTIRKRLSSEMMDMHPGIYQIVGIIQSAQDQKTVIHRGETGYLRQGLMEYSHSLAFPGLPEGAYSLKFWVASPLGVIDQQTELNIEARKSESVKGAARVPAHV